MVSVAGLPADPAMLAGLEAVETVVVVVAAAAADWTNLLDSEAEVQVVLVAAVAADYSVILEEQQMMVVPCQSVRASAEAGNCLVEQVVDTSTSSSRLVELHHRARSRVVEEHQVYLQHHRNPDHRRSLLREHHPPLSAGDFPGSCLL